MLNKLVYKNTEWDNDTLLDISTLQYQSLDLRNLIPDEADIVIDAVNPFSGGIDQSSMIAQFSGQQPVASWFVQALERTSKTQYNVSCTSRIGLLDQVTHYGGIYTGETVGTVLSGILGDIPHTIDPIFTGIKLYGWLPIATARENLIQVLFAANMSVQSRYDGLLEFGNLPALPTDMLSADDYAENDATVKLDAPITRIVLLEHNYVLGTEPKVLFEGVTYSGQIIRFDEPCGNLSATGFSVTDSGANFAVVSNGSGTLIGTPYVDTTREIVRDVTSASVVNEERIEGATLVGVTASSDVADRLQEYYRHRKRIIVSVIDKMPKGVINIFDPYDEEFVPACIEQASLSASNQNLTQISALVDFTPWQTAEYEDVRVLLTGSGMWTVPEGVSNITVVLIGGGQGGCEGKQGGEPKKPGTTTDRINNGKYNENYINVSTAIEPTTDDAGIGGLPGEPGVGGNILRQSLTVLPGAQIQYTCGVGGSGALFGSNADGSLGTDTTFGTLNSEDGAPLNAGYYDGISGTIFGRVGDAGVPGGKGQSYGDLQPEQVLWDGVYYHAGDVISEEGIKVSNSSTAYGSFQVKMYSGHGGGAAAGADGADGNYGRCYAYENAAIAYLPPGGAGGNAQKPKKPTTYGQGGSGGNGGGGRGGYGRATCQTGYIPVRNTSAPGSVILNVESPLPGGNGSDGGDGADGCVIIYYRVLSQEQGGN